jgi:hypothetical protein
MDIIIAAEDYKSRKESCPLPSKYIYSNQTHTHTHTHLSTLILVSYDILNGNKVTETTLGTVLFCDVASANLAYNN